MEKTEEVKNVRQISRNIKWKKRNKSFTVSTNHRKKISGKEALRME